MKNIKIYLKYLALLIVFILMCVCYLNLYNTIFDKANNTKVFYDPVDLKVDLGAIKNMENDDYKLYPIHTKKELLDLNYALNPQLINSYYVTDKYMEFLDLKYIYGNSFVDSEMMEANNYIVIPDFVALDLCATYDAVGREFYVNYKKYKVCGVYDTGGLIEKFSSNNLGSVYLQLASTDTLPVNRLVVHNNRSLYDTMTDVVSKNHSFSFWNRMDYGYFVVLQSLCLCLVQIFMFVMLLYFIIAYLYKFLFKKVTLKDSVSSIYSVCFSGVLIGGIALINPWYNIIKTLNLKNIFDVSYVWKNVTEYITTYNDVFGYDFEVTFIFNCFIIGLLVLLVTMCVYFFMLHFQKAIVSNICYRQK